jgi:hypothetical protein
VCAIYDSYMEILFSWHWAEYAWFYIDSAATMYTLRTSTTAKAGSVNDPINFPSNNLNGQPFTARDVDNDNYLSGNCAQLWQGGWWYNYCGRFSLNAGSTLYQWQPLAGLVPFTLRASRMMVTQIP